MESSEVVVAEPFATVIANQRPRLASFELSNLCFGVCVFLGIILCLFCLGGLNLFERLVLVVLEPLERTLYCEMG